MKPRTEAARATKVVNMRGTLVIAFVLVSAWIFSVSLAFAPRGSSFPRQRYSQLSLSSATALSYSSPEDRVRNLLDEAVALYQVATVEQLPSQGDAERFMHEVSQALHSVLTTPESLILQDLSRQLDQSIMEATQKSDYSLEQVEILALQYTEVQKMAQNPGIIDLEERLHDLQQLVEVHRTIPVLREEVTETKVTEYPSRLDSLNCSSLHRPIMKSVTEAVSVITSTTEHASQSNVAHYSKRASRHGTKQHSSIPLRASVDSYQPSSDKSSAIVNNHDIRPADTSTSSADDNDLETIEEIDTSNDDSVDEVDVAIVGAGIGGLCAGAILNTLYNKTVGIYESHYLPGGCAHAFQRRAANGVDFTFDSGPTIVLGCSAPPYNPLRQILNAIGQSVEWIPYNAWGMIENPGRDNEMRWRLELGPDAFEQGPLLEFGGKEAQEEFGQLRKLTKGLVAGAVEIPAMAMRPGSSALIPLLRYLPALVSLLKQGELSTGTFAPFMDGPLFTVKNQWFRSWLDGLAFSLSGLPAARTSAAAMAYVLFDMHRSGAALDYPTGGLGSVIDALVKGVEQGSNGSKVHLRRHVESIDTSMDGVTITGLTLRGGKKVKTREGVICNAPVWSLNNLIKNEHARQVLDNFLPSHGKRKPRQSWKLDDSSGDYVLTKRESFKAEDSLFFKTDTAEMTGSFLHLHLAIKSDGLDVNKMEAHYTVMDRSLLGNGPSDGPCGELNMIAVSNPCVIDQTLAPEGYMVIHAYGAGNEPYQPWKDVKRNSAEYKKLKEERAEVLWRAVESIIPDVRDRVVLQLIGSPKTHERFLRRPNGTYGAATEDYLKDGSTPFGSLFLAGDGIFPGIGVPAVALSGASAANGLLSPMKQWQCLDRLKQKRLI